MPFREDLGCWVPKFHPENQPGTKAEELFFLKPKGPFTPAILVAGPRETGKTIAVVHKIMRHLWLTDRARFGVVAKTVKNAKIAGVVRDFTDFVLPEWMEANLLTKDGKDKLRYTSWDSDRNPGPKNEAATKTWYFKIRNYWGTESELFLFSLDHDSDVEDKFKNTRFSGIYFPELDRFKDPKIFSITYHQLRLVHLRDDQLLWIADTNPAEEGPDHFAYKYWYQDNDDRFADLGLTDEEIQEVRDGIVLREFFLEDNPWLTRQRLIKVKALYRSDPDLWNRYVLGKWVRVAIRGAFKDVFVRNIHVVGDVSAPNPDDWETLAPTENTFELQAGWDLGDVNHSAHIGCRRPCDDNDESKFAYDVIDELVFIHDKISLVDFTELMLEKMDYWEAKMLEWYGVKKLLWRHWSDRSVFRYRSALDSIEELEVRRISNGRILLRSPGIQGDSGVNKRMQLLRRILHEDRIAVSAQLRHTIEMLVNSNKRDLLTRSGHRYKHPFDSLTYWLAGEEPESIERQTLAKSRPTAPLRIITVGGR